MHVDDDSGLPTTGSILVVPTMIFWHPLVKTKDDLRP